jgi:hypothetical protein
MSADVIPKVINDIKITASLFEAGLKCLTNCFLLSRGERGSDSCYAHWVQYRNEFYQDEMIRRLTAGTEPVEYATGRADAKNLTRAEWRLAMDLTAAARNMESTIAMLERLPEGQGEPARFVPIRFVYTNKLTLQLDQFGMRASMSRKGNCYDNAPMESFWGTFKSELVHHRRYTTRGEAVTEITEYIEIFYNRERRQKRLGYLSPAAYVKKFYAGRAAA